MGKAFSDKAKISKHGFSFSIHPDKIIIQSMGWKNGDYVRIIPVPNKGLICLKGKKIKPSTFSKNFRINYVKNNKTKYKKVSKILISFLKNKFQSLDYAIYDKEFKKYLQSLREIDSIIKKDDAAKSRMNLNLDNRFKNKTKKQAAFSKRLDEKINLSIKSNLIDQHSELIKRRHRIKEEFKGVNLQILEIEEKLKKLESKKKVSS